MVTCRSELARDKPESAAGHLATSVIVDDHRERARSYNNLCKNGCQIKRLRRRTP